MVEKPADVAHFGAIDAILGGLDQICRNYALCGSFRFKRAHFLARQILSSVRNYKLALADVHPSHGDGHFSSLREALAARSCGSLRQYSQALRLLSGFAVQGKKPKLDLTPS